MPTAPRKTCERTHYTLPERIDTSVEPMIERLVCQKWALSHRMDNPGFWRQTAAELHGMAQAFLWWGWGDSAELWTAFNELSYFAVEHARRLETRP